MSKTLYKLFNELDHELKYLDTLIKGANYIRENAEEAKVESDLLSLAEEKVDYSQDLLKEISQEFRKGDKKPDKTKPHLPPLGGSAIGGSTFLLWHPPTICYDFPTGSCLRRKLAWRLANRLHPKCHLGHKKCGTFWHPSHFDG